MDKSNSFVYKMAMEMRGSEKECFFYGILLPLFESYGLDCNFAPRSYLGDKDLLILEDLSQQSFVEFAKHKPLDLQTCKICLETLAKFHVTSILYEIKKSKELGRQYTLFEDYGDILQEEFCSGKDIRISKYFRYSVLGLCDLIDLIPMNKIDKNEFKIKLQELLELMFVKRSNHEEFKSTVVHGDVWHSNFLCQNDEKGQTKKCKLIDYQTMSYGPLANDVLLFIFTNTRKKFRNLHIQELLEYYYISFSSLLEKNHVKPSDVLSESDFINACKTFTPLASLFAAIDHSLTSISDERFKEATVTEEMVEQFWGEDRGTFIVERFGENEEYKEVIIEEITELGSMLFPKL